MGKSSLLRAVADRVGNATCVACGAQAFDIRAAIHASEEPRDVLPSVILVDNAQVLIEPGIGGLARFDDVLAFARGNSEKTTWVFALDASLWPLLKRARDALPMFDQTHLLLPWNEVQLGELLGERSDAAGISPSYDRLLDKLPLGADEVERQEALRAKRTGYERMLWDYVGGNPGLALEVWRASLSLDEAGGVHVRPLQVPDIAKLEGLPDSSLFVLRAVLQHAPATAEAVARATRLRTEEVLQEFRFGIAQGYYEEADRARVAWPWLRGVTRLLERRHLLVTP
jgi:hypothetical protein